MGEPRLPVDNIDKTIEDEPFEALGGFEDSDNKVPEEVKVEVEDVKEQGNRAIIEVESKEGAEFSQADLNLAYRRSIIERYSLWQQHFDSQKEGISSSLLTQRATDWLLDASILAQNAFEHMPKGWQLERNDALGLSIDSAEALRRAISPDNYWRVDTISNKEENPNDTKPSPLSPSSPLKLKQNKRVLARLKLHGLHNSVAPTSIKNAETTGNYEQFTPLASERKYLPVSLSDIGAINHENIDTAMQLYADLLSPDRNEKAPINSEAMYSIVRGISMRHEELASIRKLVLTWTWRIAQQQHNKKLAEDVVNRIGLNSTFGKLLETYSPGEFRSEEHTSELQSHSFISYAVFCLKKKKKTV